MVAIPREIDYKIPIERNPDYLRGTGLRVLGSNLLGYNCSSSDSHRALGVPSVDRILDSKASHLRVPRNDHPRMPYWWSWMIELAEESSPLFGSGFTIWVRLRSDDGTGLANTSPGKWARDVSQSPQ
jgi:hypothetical protein